MTGRRCFAGAGGIRIGDGMAIWSAAELERLRALQACWTSLDDVESEAERGAIVQEAMARLEALTTIRDRLRPHIADQPILDELRLCESAMFACRAVLSGEQSK
jgi:hypothetical protein